MQGKRDPSDNDFFDLIGNDLDDSLSSSRAFDSKKATMTFEEFKKNLETTEMRASSHNLKPAAKRVFPTEMIITAAKPSKPSPLPAFSNQGSGDKTLVEFFSELVSYRVGKRDWQKFNYPVNKTQDLKKLLQLVFKNIFGATLHVVRGTDTRGNHQMSIMLDTNSSHSKVLICRVTWIGGGPHREEYPLIALMRKLGEEMAEKVVKDQSKQVKEGFMAWTKSIQIIDAGKGVFTGRNPGEDYVTGKSSKAKEVVPQRSILEDKMSKEPPSLQKREESSLVKAEDSMSIERVEEDVLDRAPIAVPKQNIKKGANEGVEALNRQNAIEEEHHSLQPTTKLASSQQASEAVGKKKKNKKKKKSTPHTGISNSVGLIPIDESKDKSHKSLLPQNKMVDEASEEDSQQSHTQKTKSKQFKHDEASISVRTEHEVITSKESSQLAKRPPEPEIEYKIQKKPQNTTFSVELKSTVKEPSNTLSGIASSKPSTGNKQQPGSSSSFAVSLKKDSPPRGISYFATTGNESIHPEEVTIDEEDKYQEEVPVHSHSKSSKNQKAPASQQKNEDEKKQMYSKNSDLQKQPSHHQQMVGGSIGVGVGKSGNIDEEINRETIDTDNRAEKRGKGGNRGGDWNHNPSFGSSRNVFTGGKGNTVQDREDGGNSNWRGSNGRGGHANSGGDRARAVSSRQIMTSSRFSDNKVSQGFPNPGNLDDIRSSRGGPQSQRGNNNRGGNRGRGNRTDRNGSGNDQRQPYGSGSGEGRRGAEHYHGQDYTYQGPVYKGRGDLQGAQRRGRGDQYRDEGNYRGRGGSSQWHNNGSHRGDSGQGNWSRGGGQYNGKSHHQYSEETIQSYPGDQARGSGNNNQPTTKSHDNSQWPAQEGRPQPIGYRNAFRDDPDSRNSVPRDSSHNQGGDNRNAGQPKIDQFNERRRQWASSLAKPQPAQGNSHSQGGGFKSDDYFKQFSFQNNQQTDPELGSAGQSGRSDHRPRSRQGN